MSYNHNHPHQHQHGNFIPQQSMPHAAAGHMGAPYPAVAPNFQQHGGAPHNGGYPQPPPARGQGGVRIDAVNPVTGERLSWWAFSSGTLTFLTVLSTAIAVFALIGVIWFFVRLPGEESEDAFFSRVRFHKGRYFWRAPMVAMTNYTVLGLNVLQGGMLIGSPTIPGSGYLIVNKRSLKDSNPHPEERADLHDVEFVEEDEHNLVFKDPRGVLRENFSKRNVEWILPENGPKWSGITFTDQSNITMNGGDIVGVNDIYARHLYIAVNETVGSTAGLELGLLVGPLINGSVARGYSPVPVAGETIVQQLFFLNEDDQDGFAVARFNNQRFIMFYLDALNGALQAIVGDVDSNNEATYSSPAEVLAAGVLGSDMQVCSLEGSDGTGANVAMVVYRSALDGNLYARVCDFTNAGSPTCGPSTNLTSGDLGVNGVLVYDQASNIHLNGLACQIHPDDGASTLQRWFTIGATTNNSGIMMSQQISANVSAALPVSIVRTPTVIVGNVNDLTSVSVSTDLANQGKHQMQLDRLSFGYFVIAWRTNSSHLAGKVEVNYINTTGPAIQLTTRCPQQWVSADLNTDGASWVFDISVSQRGPYLLGGEMQVVYIGYAIGQSSFGHLWTSTLGVPLTANAAFPSNPWYEQQLGQFANSVNPIYTYAYPQAATFTVEAMCTSQVLISYVGPGVSAPQSGYTVLVNAFPNQGCTGSGTCMSISSTAQFTTTLPYYALTAWRTLSSDSFVCDGTDFSQFVTAFVIYDAYSETDTLIKVGLGIAGEYSLGYGPFDVPQYVTGIVTGIYANQSLVTVQNTGNVNVCSWPYTIDGYACPFEKPGPVYACHSGYLSFSQFCAASNTLSPGQYVGYTNIWGDLELSPNAAIAFAA